MGNRGILLPFVSFTVFVFIAFNCSHPTAPAIPSGADTTSHVYVWQVDTLGGAYSSNLSDVAIVDDTCAFAVGSLYLTDSTGKPDPVEYGLASWNGKSWTLYRVYYQYQGQQLVYAGITAVLAFSSQDVWIGSSTAMHWDGNSWYHYAIPSSVFAGAARKLWGMTSNSIYMVGTNGSIAHFDGSSWTRINSGTTVDLVDIWGTSANDVWIVGLNVQSGQSLLLHYDGNSFRTAYSYSPPFQGYSADSLNGDISSVWTNSRDRIWVADADVYLCPSTTIGQGQSVWRSITPIGFGWRIRGSDSNNIFVVGSSGLIVHYNGSTWFQYQQFQDFSANGMGFGSVAVASSMILAVGSSNGRAVILRGVH